MKNKILKNVDSLYPSHNKIDGYFVSDIPLSRCMEVIFLSYPYMRNKGDQDVTIHDTNICHDMIGLSRKCLQRAWYATENYEIYIKAIIIY